MKKKTIQRLLTLGIIHLIFSFNLWPTNPPKITDQYTIDEWETSSTFPWNSVSSFAQTEDGYLWIGTRKGLIRYNGLKFEKINIEQSQKDHPELITSLLTDRKGNLWVGSLTGLSRYHFLNGNSFKTFTKKEGLSGDRITCIMEDTLDNLWVGTRNDYLNYFQQGKIKTFTSSHKLAPRRISSLCLARGNSILIGAFQEGLLRYESGRFTKYDLETKTLKNDYVVLSVFQDKRGVDWIGTDKGLLRVKNHRFDLYTVKHGLTANRILNITEDEEEVLWVGTPKGLNRVNKGKDNIIGIEVILAGDFISCVFPDREKNIWIGTFGSGMKRLRSTIFRMLLTESDSFYYNLPLLEDTTGTIWIGMNYGKLLKYRNDNLASLSFQKGIENMYIYSLTEDKKGNIWLGTRSHGLLKIRKGRLMNYSDENGLINNPINVIYCNNRNTLWIGTYKGGLIRLKNGILKTHTMKDGLSSNKIYSLCEDKDHNLWVGTRRGINVLKNGQLDPETMTKYLPENLITVLYQDDHSIFWVGTLGKGLFRIENKGLTAYTIKNGLKTKHIAHILEDQHNEFWISSTDGIINVKKRELNEFARGNIKRINCRLYGLADGLKSNECIYSSKNTAIKTRQGELWFATRKGIAAINPVKMRKNNYPPPVVIETVTVDNIPYMYQTAKNISNFTDIEKIEFSFTALTYISPAEASFESKLEGYEKEWNFLNPGKERVARYTNLPSGKYTFKVIASNQDGCWNKTGAAFSFTIKKSFVKSPVFKVIIIIFMIIFIITLVKKYLFYKHKYTLKFSRTVKYRKTKIDSVKAKEYQQKLITLLENKKIYKDETISLQTLATQMSMPSFQLSQLINDYFDKNFYDLINTYRIKESKELLVDSNKNNLTVFEIALEVGFNSKSAFNRAFKKYEKMSPSEFKIKHKIKLP